MKKPVVLYIDQHGNPFWAHTLKELRAQIPGKVSIMYRDVGKDVYQEGYVIGRHWLQAYTPLRKKVTP